MPKPRIKPELLNQFITWRYKPQVFVREVFGATPDAWQDKVLEAFPHHPRIAMKASKGPGKTCVEAWLAWNFLLTRPHPNIAGVSISADNLRDNLWKEMAVWLNKSPLLQQMFEYQKERIFARDHPDTWWMSARSWAKTASDEDLGLTLAGLHSDYCMAILDESGGMPVPILQAAEGIMSILHGRPYRPSWQHQHLRRRAVSCVREARDHVAHDCHQWGSGQSTSLAPH